MPGANVFAYDGTSFKPTDLSLTASIAAQTASGASSSFSAVTFGYNLSAVNNQYAATQIWQGLPPTPTVTTFVQATPGTIPNKVQQTTISWTCSSSALLSKFQLFRKQVGVDVSFLSYDDNISSADRSYVIQAHEPGTYRYFVKSVGISGLTQTGPTGEFTITAPSGAGTSIASGSITSSSAQWTYTFPAGIFQKIDWYYFDSANADWYFETTSTISAGATTATRTRSGLLENTSFFVGAVLYNYNGHLLDFAYASATTLNEPPAAPTITAVTAVAATKPALNSGIPPTAGAGGYATEAAVKKQLTVSYTLSADTDYFNHVVRLYTTNALTTEVTNSGNIVGTAFGAKTHTFSNLDPSESYYARVTQRDSNSGATNSAVVSGTTQAVQSYQAVDDFDTATGTTYSEGANTFETRTNISTHVTSVSVSSAYTGTLTYGGNLLDSYDNNSSTYYAWRVVNNVFGTNSVGTITFVLGDSRYDFLKYGVTGAQTRTNQVKHGVAVQIQNNANSAWLGAIAANSSKTRNSQPIVHDVDNNDFVQIMSWGGGFGIGVTIKNSNAAGAVAFGNAGNGGSVSYDLRLNLRNPAPNPNPSGNTVFWTHLNELDSVSIYYTKENSVTTYTTTPAVTRYY